MKREEYKSVILKYMETNCFGIDKARKRYDIIHAINRIYGINIPEREFRRITSEMKKENLICSLSSVGYWFHPLHTNDRRELEAFKASWQEMENRAKNTIVLCSKNIREVDARLQTATGEQSELPLVGK